MSRRRLIRRVNRWARYIRHYRHIEHVQCGGRRGYDAIEALADHEARRRWHHG